MLRFAARLLLACALLGAQVGGFRHALTHVGEALDARAALKQGGLLSQGGSNDRLPNNHPCELCHVYAAADGGVVSSSGLAIALAAALQLLFREQPAPHLALALAFSSRAPPLV